MEVILHAPGMFSSVQDLGRTGYRAQGVALGGAVDRFAHKVANLLVGNPVEMATIETTLIGPELEFTHDTLVAVTGAEFADVPCWRPFLIHAGERLMLGKPLSGARGYVAVSGGIDVPRILGGRGTYLRAGFGGLEGRVLREGDRLPIGPERKNAKEHWALDRRILPHYSPAPTVRAVRGAHLEHFSPSLFGAAFPVSPQSDRMGMRLGGAALAGKAPELLSSAVLPGTVQIPPDGHPIVLLADAQTIGGYPRVAHVILADLPLLAQLKPGDTVHFEEVSLDEAHLILTNRERALGLLKEGLADKFY